MDELFDSAFKLERRTWSWIATVSESLAYKLQGEVGWTADNGQPFLILRHGSQRRDRLGMGITGRWSKSRADTWQLVHSDLFQSKHLASKRIEPRSHT